MSETDDLPRVLSLRQAAQSLGISAASLRRLIDRGELRSIRLGKRRRGVLQSDLTFFLENQKTGGQA
jgi:excisionase family DNA binding protein